MISFNLIPNLIAELRFWTAERDPKVRLSLCISMAHLMVVRSLIKGFQCVLGVYALLYKKRIEKGRKF